MSMIRYNLPEEEMQELIQKAQAGNGKAQDRLLTVFGNFLSNYVQLLYYGKYSISDSSDLRSFIALYVGDPQVRIPLLRNKLDRKGYLKVAEVVSGLQMMTQRYGSEEDVTQTVRMAFLHTVKVYKRRESKGRPGEFVPFAGYINQYFKYTMKKLVDEFLIDQNGLHTFALKSEEPGIGMGQGEDGDEMQRYGFKPPPGPALEDALGPSVIDENWVAGDTARFPFDSLSIQERQLIKWRYADGLKTSEISDKITEHPNTLREHFNKIQRKIRESQRMPDLR